MIIGTANFVSRDAADAYYSPEVAEYKLLEGEISIGRPVVKPGQHCFVCPKEGRYHIQVIRH